MASKKLHGWQNKTVVNRKLHAWQNKACYKRDDTWLTKQNMLLSRG